MKREVITEHNNAMHSGGMIVCIQTAIVFLSIYSFTLYQAFTTEILAICLAIIYSCIQNRFKIELLRGLNNWRNSAKLLLFTAIPLLYSRFLLYFYGNGTGETITFSLMIFILYGLTELILFSNVFRSADELMKAVLYATLIQCFVILLGILIPSFAKMIDSSFANSGAYFDYSFMRAKGYCGGISCITSTGSVKLSLGMVACLHCMMKKENIAKYIIYYLFICFISLTVARTSLLFSLIGLVVIFIYFHKFDPIKARIILSWIAFGGAILIMLFIFFNLGDKFASLFTRFLDLKASGIYDGFVVGYLQVEGYSTGGIPPLSLNTIIGTGIISGISGNGIYVNADGGFFKTYAALGLVMAIVVYLFIFSILRKSNRNVSNNNRMIGGILFAFMILAELKEPTIFYTRFYIIIVLIYLITSESDNENGNSWE